MAIVKKKNELWKEAKEKGLTKGLNYTKVSADELEELLRTEYKKVMVPQPITQEKKDELNVDGWKICHVNLIGNTHVEYTLKRLKK